MKTFELWSNKTGVQLHVQSNAHTVALLRSSEPHKGNVEKDHVRLSCEQQASLHRYINLVFLQVLMVKRYLLLDSIVLLDIKMPCYFYVENLPVAFRSKMMTRHRWGHLSHHTHWDDLCLADSPFHKSDIGMGKGPYPQADFQRIFSRIGRCYPKIGRLYHQFCNSQPTAPIKHV